MADGMRISPKQMKVLTWWQKGDWEALICDGSVRSGKTFAMGLSFFLWYEQTAMNYGGVVAAKAVGRARGIGTVDVYVATQQGVPDAELLSGLQTALQEKREIAVDVAVKAPTVKTVDVAVAVAPKSSANFVSVKAQVEKTVSAFFAGNLLGNAVRLAELGHQIYAVDGVENYRFSSPVGDIAAVDTVLPVLGSLAVTEMEA